MERLKRCLPALSTFFSSSFLGFCRGARALKVLGYTGDIRALDPIFEIVKNSSEEEFEELKEWIQVVLFTPEYLLAKKLKREESKRLDQMLIDLDERVIKRAKELHEYMLSPNGMC